ncbi:hypothetical protein NDU88_004946 [Pleurodeles waltl]|uniref:Uncharacterized protein n=1 Tax=Pleurodeles waltl TaxID=8319 RepID=A0AAV7UGL7_PLEWA|nr:hypothetical protein NDU88_004946 [Pleurodeles waltl]
MVDAGGEGCRSNHNIRLGTSQHKDLVCGSDDFWVKWAVATNNWDIIPDECRDREGEEETRSNVERQSSNEEEGRRPEKHEEDRSGPSVGGKDTKEPVPGSRDNAVKEEDGGDRDRGEQEGTEDWRGELNTRQRSHVPGGAWLYKPNPHGGNREEKGIYLDYAVGCCGSRSKHIL